MKVHPLWPNLVYILSTLWLLFEKAERNITNCSNPIDGIVHFVNKKYNLLIYNWALLVRLRQEIILSMPKLSTLWLFENMK